MTPPDGGNGPAFSGGTQFDERLSVPLWWWLPALAVVGLIVLDVRLGHPSWPAWLPVVILLPLVGTALVRLGRFRIRVTSDAEGQLLLRVGPATLPARFVAEATAIRPRDKQLALGPELDPTAYVLHRPWIGPMVRVTLNDPADPTPYWIFSVRNPEALLECLRARHGQGHNRRG